MTVELVHRYDFSDTSDGGYDSYEAEHATTYECDDRGAWLVASEMTSHWSVGDASGSTEARRTYEGALVMVRDPTRTPTWSSEVEVFDPDAGGARINTYTRAYRVVETDSSVTVPAGAWDGCVRIETDLDEERSRLRTYHPEVGLLVATDTASGAAVTYALTAHSGG
jgi:hypothetical protein